MKKIFFTLAIGLFGLANAQIDWSSTRFGVIAGPNYSGVKNAHNPSGKKWSYFAGGLALIPIGSDNQFYIQPEVEYVSTGEKGSGKNADADYNQNYISVPIYFKGYFSESESEVFAYGGPRVGFLVSQKVTNPSKPYYTIEGLDVNGVNVNGKANSIDFALSLGIGYSYKRQMEMSLRYDLGLSNVYKGLMNEPGFDPNIQKKKTSQIISLGISYIFK